MLRPQLVGAHAPAAPCREHPEQVFSARDEANVYHIPRHFTAKAGARLNDDLVVGRHLSSGLQGGVYLVNDNLGNETDFVVKACPCRAPRRRLRPSAAAAASADRVRLERGVQRLAAQALADPRGAAGRAPACAAGRGGA